jgi:hypothetical protein
MGHVWFVDPLVRTLEILRLDESTYRIEPFDAIELDMATLWAR